MDYLETVEYWSTRVPLLANWLVNTGKVSLGITYGSEYLKRMCDEFDNTPGAGSALAEHGYMRFVERSGGTSWWTWIHRT